MATGRIPAVTGVSHICLPGPGGNSGNVLHAMMARRLLQHHDELSRVRPWADEEVERVQATNSHIVVVVANALRLGATPSSISGHHDMMAQNFSRVDLPLVVMSAGAQAPKRNSIADGIVVPEATIRLFKLLSKRSHAIAVRGDFTAEVLRGIGVDNTEVIGCQSCFWSLQPEFPTSFEEAKSRTEVAYNCTSVARERNLVELAVQNGYQTFGQEHPVENAILRGDESGLDAEWPWGVLFSRTSVTREAFVAYIKETYRHHYELETWSPAMKEFRFSFGSRFHGNMVAMHAGVPSLWVAHDTRTEDLTSHLRLPSIALDEAMSFKHTEQFIERADYSEFLKAYPHNYRRLSDFLERAGLPQVLPPPVV